MAIDMMRRRKIINYQNQPGQKLGETRISDEHRHTPPGIVDLARSRDERTVNYLKRAKKRRI